MPGMKKKLLTKHSDEKSLLLTFITLLYRLPVSFSSNNNCFLLTSILTIKV